jgi:hypothetical protein
MKLSLLAEDLPPDKTKESRKPPKKVWQDEESQGKRHKRWYTGKIAGPDPGTYRWGTGKPMSGDGYEEHILPVGESRQRTSVLAESYEQFKGWCQIVDHLEKELQLPPGPDTPAFDGRIVNLFQEDGVLYITITSDAGGVTAIDHLQELADYFNSDYEGSNIAVNTV